MKLVRVLMTLCLVVSSFVSSGQKQVVGLYGDCDNKFGGYVCQQIALERGGTFKFYDLLHLRGWHISTGKWSLNGDTVVLNSTKFPYKVKYSKKSCGDSIVVEMKSSKNYPVKFLEVYSNGKMISLDSTGVLRFRKAALDTVWINTMFYAIGPIVLNQKKVAQAGRLKISVQVDPDLTGQHLFNDVKWLLKDEKLYHSTKGDGTYDEEMYFDKVDGSRLKYNVNY